VKLIVGLGNPGAQYERTRHNAGFMAVDLLADRHAKGGIARSRFSSATLEVQMPGASAPEKCLLMKPTTYMNRSGLAVAEAVRFFKLDPVADVLVLVDDVYLPCGTIRLRESGAAGGHNGLGDIERLLGSDRYPRCRIGVDAPGIVPQADYVLGRFSEVQWPLVKEALVKAADASELFVRSGINAAMNKFNGKAAEHQQRRTERPPASPSSPSAATSTPTASSTASSTPGPSTSPTASPTPNPS
jgi:peptidyl-tRNA hydrolase, PTH1 family